MKPKFANMSNPATGFVATGTSTAGQTLDVEGYDVPVGVGVFGTFVGTMQIEVSMDGTNWAPFGAALTAPGTVKIDIPVKMVRAHCTAWTSGAIIVYAGVVDTNTADSVG